MRLRVKDVLILDTSRRAASTVVSTFRSLVMISRLLAPIIHNSTSAFISVHQRPKILPRSPRHLNLVPVFRKPRNCYRHLSGNRSQRVSEYALVAHASRRAASTVVSTFRSATGHLVPEVHPGSATIANDPSRFLWPLILFSNLRFLYPVSDRLCERGRSCSNPQRRPRHWDAQRISSSMYALSCASLRSVVSPRI
jgi:hypothetical protein